MERLVANYKTMPMQTLIDNTLLPTPALHWENHDGDQWRYQIM